MAQNKWVVIKPPILNRCVCFALLKINTVNSECHRFFTGVGVVDVVLINSLFNCSEVVRCDVFTIVATVLHINRPSLRIGKVTCKCNIRTIRLINQKASPSSVGVSICLILIVPINVFKRDGDVLGITRIMLLLATSRLNTESLTRMFAPSFS